MYFFSLDIYYLLLLLLFTNLTFFLERLTKCEKALAEYLETKRLAFPRFYFVSPADLLDILSKGNQPLEVRVFGFKFFFLCFLLNDKFQ